MKILLAIFALLVVTATYPATLSAQSKHFVVVNDDSFPSANTTTIYRIGGTRSAPSLTLARTITTGGFGDGDGYLEGQQQTFVRHGTDQCLFISDAGTPDVAAINARTGTLVGNFRGSFNDSANQFGIALLPSADGRLLYAAYRPVAFAQSSSIATFQIGAGCTLTFLNDTFGFGTQGGGIEGMASHGNILVVGYGDGSLESFRISGNTLTSNHDKQNSTGFTSHNNGLGPGSVQITRDGHFAVFGDVVSNIQGQFTEIEVSDISSGKLTPTVDFGGANHAHDDLGTGISSNSAVLSSDEKHIYASNVLSGQVTVLNFDATTGTVSLGCISAPLQGFGATFTATGQIAAAGISPNGNDVLFVAEDGDGLSSGVGILTVNFSGSSCTVSESVNSPASDPNSLTLKSLTTF